MNLSVITVPWDSGHYKKRMGLGPCHIINQGLLDLLENQGHNVDYIDCNPINSFTTELGSAKTLNTTLAKSVRKAKDAGRFPIVLSGNCNMAIGLTAGLNPIQPALAWFDAHADFNTPETSTTGFFDGMGLSVLTGNSWKKWRKTIPGFIPVEERKVLLIGAREFDAGEEELLKSSEINLIAVSFLRSKPEASISQPVKTITKSCKDLYIHFDLDVLDPGELMANEFSAEQGLFLSEIERALNVLSTRFKIRAITFSSYDPSYDRSGKAINVVISVLNTVLPSISHCSS